MRHNVKQARKIRVPRLPASPLHMDDTSHLWAVSYADFLMVLLSFFVIFFSVDHGKKNGIVQKILLSLKSEPGATPGARGAGAEVGGVTDQPSKDRSPQSLPNTLRLKLGSFLVKESGDREKIVIDLPDDFYRLGEVDVEPKFREQLMTIIDDLVPYSDQIVVGFVGHADMVPVKGAASKSFTSNHDISVVRASRALTLAAARGFPLEHAYASGSGSQVRKTRSLTLVVRPLLGGVL